MWYKYTFKYCGVHVISLLVYGSYINTGANSLPFSDGGAIYKFVRIYPVGKDSPEIFRKCKNSRVAYNLCFKYNIGCSTEITDVLSKTETSSLIRHVDGTLACDYAVY